MARASFYRVGQPVRIPVSPTSGSTQFHLELKGEQLMVPDLTFMFVNQNPFDVRLEGTQKDKTFMDVNQNRGWLIMARTVMGPFTSKKPEFLSAQAFGSPGNPLPENFNYDECYLELVYGRGE